MIYVTGDLHREIDAAKLNSRNFKMGKKLTKNDYVIVCSDMRVVWDDSKEGQYFLKWLDSKPWTTLFIDGNHENFDKLYEYPVEEWNGGKVHFITPSIIHLMRGQVFTIGDKIFFTMGGASSHDKIYRTEGKS